jgi:hypothetical protein
MVGEAVQMVFGVSQAARTRPLEAEALSSRRIEGVSLSACGRKQLSGLEPLVLYREDLANVRTMQSGRCARRIVSSSPRPQR